MRWTRSLISTLREEPQEAEITSHKLLLRAGMIRRLSGGLYTFMPLGVRVLQKVSQIVREEMNRAGAQEILMPALQPAELWERTGRLETMGAGMFKLKDRMERTMTLGPTHEEVVTQLLAHEVSSYRQLPCTVYQIQTKFRDEIRPRFGLMRAKEFIMKDAYSFDTTLDAADASYAAMYDAYVRIFNRCGLQTRAVEADTGDIGGKWSHEFMVLADSGEDGILECAACGYAANQERAERTVIPESAAKDRELPLQSVATPDIRTIDQLVAFFKCEPDTFVKTLIYLADTKPVAVLLPGSRELNEPKLKRMLNVKTLAMADDKEVERITGAPVGFAGAVNLDLPIYADQNLVGATNRITGANQDNTHLTNVALERDIKVTAFGDIVVVEDGDICPHCPETLHLRRGIEVGHVFKLGTKYSQDFDATYLNERGESELMVMGCYGIGVTRTLQAVVEQNNDRDGIRWPISVAPFAVNLLMLDPHDAAVSAATEQIETGLQAIGVDVLTDDREERPGIKFKDADLIGSPIRVVISSRGMANNTIEVKLRGEREHQVVPCEEGVKIIKKIADQLMDRLQSN